MKRKRSDWRNSHTKSSTLQVTKTKFTSILHNVTTILINHLKYTQKNIFLADLNVPKTLKKYGRKMKRYLKTKVKDHMDRIAEEYSDVGYSSSDSNNSEHSR